MAVIFDITMTLDGYIAGPNPTLEQPLGEGGDRIHEWMYQLASFREQHGMSGGTTNPDSEGQQYLEAGLVDELQIHLVPLLLGGGRRLFDDSGAPRPELEVTRVIDSPSVTQLRYRVVR